jgi:exopolysaccharide biosynthesis polyprenyl glycosylphosphotransferase
MWVDWALTVVAWTLPLVALDGTGRSVTTSLLWGAGAAAALVGLFARRSRYEVPVPPRSQAAGQVARCTVLVGAGVVLTTGAIGASAGASAVLTAMALSVVLLLLTYEVRRLTAVTGRTLRVAIVGTGPEAIGLVRLIDDHPETGFEVVGVIGDRDVSQRSGIIDRWIGPCDDVMALLAAHEVDLPIVLANSFRREQFRLLSRSLLQAGYDVSTSSGVGRIDGERLKMFSLAHEPLEVTRSRAADAGLSRAKRLIDVVGSAGLMALLAPVAAAIALAVKLGDRGPVLFSQVRVGHDGRTFEMLKFRTMVPDAEAGREELLERNERNGPLFKMDRDPRVTRVGGVLRATNLDELPQLINVLRGEMSLVGPRPALPEEVSQFDDELTGRTSVRPGMTGLWQVEANSSPSFEEYRRLDLHYAENWRLGLDTQILLATASLIVLAPLARPLARSLRLVSPGTEADTTETSALKPAGVAVLGTNGVGGPAVDLVKQAS